MGTSSCNDPEIARSESYSSPEADWRCLKLTSDTVSYACLTDQPVLQFYGGVSSKLKKVCCFYNQVADRVIILF
jgi:hypothetical protein